MSSFLPFFQVSVSRLHARSRNDRSAAARIGAAVDGERGGATECGNHHQDLPETFEGHLDSLTVNVGNGECR